MDDRMHPDASDYEARAWLAMLEQERARRDSLIGRAGDAVAAVAKRADVQIRKFPPAERALQIGDETLVKALEGGFRAVFLPAVRSVSLERRVAKLTKRHPEVSSDSLFSTIDLKDVDRGRPKLTIPLVGVLESTVASLTITGATVSTSVSGGTTAGVALVAAASDAVASMALLGRAVAEVAVHYGYDPREPEEELFLMGVLSYSTAGGAASKTTALAGLSRLSQQMMRHAAWDTLGREPLVKVIQRIFQSLGLRLTHQRLANVVPIAGGVLSAGLSFQMLGSAIDDATRIYRARYLGEKYGLNWDQWLQKSTPSDELDPDAEATVSEFVDALDELDTCSGNDAAEEKDE